MPRHSPTQQRHSGPPAEEPAAFSNIPYGSERLPVASPPSGEQNGSPCPPRLPLRRTQAHPCRHSVRSACRPSALPPALCRSDNETRKHGVLFVLKNRPCSSCSDSRQHAAERTRLFGNAAVCVPEKPVPSLASRLKAGRHAPSLQKGGKKRQKEKPGMGMRRSCSLVQTGRARETRCVLPSRGR